jgi:lipopolysaccharide export system protein LptA
MRHARRIVRTPRGLAWLVVLLALAAPAEAQTRRVEILNADFVEVQADSAGIVRRLRGNVRLRQDTTALRAERVVIYESRGQVELDGAVWIRSGADTLTAAAVAYDANTKTAVARSAARLGDGESVLTAPEMTYDARAEVARFSGGGRLLHRGATLTAPSGTYSTARRVARLDGPFRLVDSTGVLTAARGTYDARLRRADAAGDVRLRSPDARLHADSLVYFRRTERARAYGRVALERIGEAARPARVGDPPPDSTRRTLLFGETLLYDRRAASASMRGSPERPPLLLALRTDSTGRTDSTLVRAPRLDLTREVAGADTSTVLTAAGGAQVWERRLAVRADSARVVRLQRAGEPAIERLGLFGAERPRAWTQGTQLTGDSLSAETLADDVRRLRVAGRAFAARMDSVVGRVQQIQGGEIAALVRGDDLERLTVWPAAEAIYYRATADSLLAGADRIAADSLAFRFADGELREVTGVRDIRGTSFGPTTLPADLRLPGYAYDPADAPTRASVLDDDGWEAEWLRRNGAPPEPEREPEAEPEADAGG